MSLQHLSSVLFRERHLLELLLFKLEEEELVLSAGRTRWLAHASREVETVVDELSAMELARASALADVGAELGLEGEAVTLPDVVASAPVPWDGIFGEHQEVLRQLTSEVLEAVTSHRRHLREGYDVIRRALSATR
jgi:hypothetical protein